MKASLVSAFLCNNYIHEYQLVHFLGLLSLLAVNALPGLTDQRDEGKKEGLLLPFQLGFQLSEMRST